MRTIETTVFQYAELSDAAKEKARKWYRDACSDDNYFSESVISYAEDVAKILGIELDRAHGRTTEPAIFWSGFSSQGDGCYFVGDYSYAKGASAAIAAYVPQDAELLRIAKGLQDVQRRHFYRLTARCEPWNHGRGNNMQVTVQDSDNSYRDIGADERQIDDLLSSFAHWIYRQLEKEYEHSVSDEQVAENIEANEYEFTAEGDRA